MRGTKVALPAAHFAAASGLLVLGSAGLVRVAPLLAGGLHAAGPVVAVTHLFTLGWISTSIMAALYQFLPVALQREIRWRPLAWATGVAHVLGLLLFVYGLAWGGPAVAAAGGIALGAALTGFTVNLAATLRRPVTRDLTWWALAGATAFLGVTIVLGVALAANLRWGFIGAAHGVAVATHLTVALAGWVLLVVIGVSQRLLPMFLLSGGVRDDLAPLAVAAVAAGAAALAVGHHAEPVRRWVAPALLGTGAVAFVLHARALYARRHRRGLDTGLRLAAAALGLLAVAIAAGLAARFTAPAPRLAPFAVVAAILAFALYVGAFHYKIVPFLAWHRRFGPHAGQRELPRVADLYRHDAAELATMLLLGGAVVLLVGVAFALPVVSTVGAAAFALGALTLAGQMLALDLLHLPVRRAATATPQFPEHTPMATPTLLDVRVIPPREKHATIFRTFDALAPGESFTLVNDHDPVPLRYQFEAERAGAFAWEYLEQGPQVWRVEIARR